MSEASGVAEHGAARVPDMHRTGWIGRDVFDIYLGIAAKIRSVRIQRPLRPLPGAPRTPELRRKALRLTKPGPAISALATSGSVREPLQREPPRCRADCASKAWRGSWLHWSKARRVRHRAAARRRSFSIRASSPSASANSAARTAASIRVENSAKTSIFPAFRSAILVRAGKACSDRRRTHERDILGLALPEIGSSVKQALVQFGGIRVGHAGDKIANDAGPCRLIGRVLDAFVPAVGQRAGFEQGDQTGVRRSPHPWRTGLHDLFGAIDIGEEESLERA